MENIKVLVTAAGGSGGSNYIASLNLVSDIEFSISGTDTNKYMLELTSGLHAKYLLPHAENKHYLEKLNTVISQEKIEFIHFQSEQEVWFASQNFDKINAKIMIPSYEALKMLTDKSELNRHLDRAGLSVPKAFHLRNERDLQEALEELLKLGDCAWLRAKNGGGSRASLPVNTMLQAKGWIDYWIKRKNLEFNDFMISEFLPGKEFAFQSVWKDGELVCSMARQRVEYLFGHLFPSGQSSSPSVAKTIHRDDVNKAATKAIKVADPKANGVYCVDMKENSRGVPCITEINAGRFYTTSNNFSTAGLNMPYYHVMLGMDRDEKIGNLPKYNGIPENWYWVRMMDMGYKLIKDDEWLSKIVQ